MRVKTILLVLFLVLFMIGCSKTAKQDKQQVQQMSQDAPKEVAANERPPDKPSQPLLPAAAFEWVCVIDADCGQYCDEFITYLNQTNQTLPTNSTTANETAPVAPSAPSSPTGGVVTNQTNNQTTVASCGLHCSIQAPTNDTPSGTCVI